MNFIIKFFSEISVKSTPVRRQMTRQLTDNLRILVPRISPGAKILQDWDKLEVKLTTDEPVVIEAVSDLLGRVPGISVYSRVRVHELGDLHSVYEHAKEAWEQELSGKTFVVRVKRNGKHSFSSTEVERYVGGGLNQHTEAAGVDLHNPDVKVCLEIRDQVLYVIEQSFKGLGGYPIGVQDSVVSLVSGGFDSTVASYQSMRRGLKTHFLFFNLGGKAHETGVKEIAFYLWKRYSESHRVKFISIPFDGVVAEIMEKVNPSCMGVILKRMMYRAASQVVDQAKAYAMVTGEAVAQVSSQTLPNLEIIDSVTDKHVIRPLALWDKEMIIDQCRAIGAEEFSANIPEYCGVISIKPSAHLKFDRVEEQEAKMDMEALTRALDARVIQDIDAVMTDMGDEGTEVEIVSDPEADQVIIDIRHPNETDLKPLGLTGTKVVQALMLIPFYSLNRRFVDLDQSQRYLLYCDKGVMSQLHAAHLADEGFKNVGVYRP